MKLDIHHGTARIRAVVKLLEQSSLSRGQSGLAQLRLDRPIAAFYGDRFIIRDRSQQHTLGGGIVLDAEGASGRGREDRQVVFLQARAKDPTNIVVAILTQLQRDRFVATSNLLQKSPFTTEQVSIALQQLAAEHKISLIGAIAADISAWQTLRDHAIGLIDQAHARNPQDPGLNLSALRAMLASEMRTRPTLFSVEVVNALLADLAMGDFVRTGETIARRSHRLTLPDALQPLADEILRRLSDKPFDPPTLKEAAADPNARKAIQFLIETRKVFAINSDVMLLATAFEDMKSMIVSFLESKPSGATASELRFKLQTSRRILIPLLEYLDLKKITRRQGDLRILAH